MARKERPRKAEVITFKADPDLIGAMRGIRNRSEFIRDAILSALSGACPLCGGSGTLTPKQRQHWRSFAATHSVAECRRCHEVRLLCRHESAAR
jgi:hypothetical protein